jgi:hypothetical protein
MEVNMKKLTVALVIGAFACLLALPGPAAANVQFGIKAGGNMARVTGADAQDPVATLKNRVGFIAGVFVAFNMGSVFTLQLEGLYTMKGVSYVDTTLDYSQKLYGDYLEIPLLLKLRIPTPLVSPFVFAGPAVGFKLSEKLKLNGVDVPPIPGEPILKNNDYGAIFGGGLNIGSHFQIDVRYSMGLAKIVNPDPPGSPILDVKNGVWSGTIGIAF